MILLRYYCCSLFLFFFTDPATTEIYTLSLHDAFRSHGSRPLVALSPCQAQTSARPARPGSQTVRAATGRKSNPDRKSTRLNSSHPSISYAVFCLKKKKTTNNTTTPKTIHIYNTTPPP